MRRNSLEEFAWKNATQSQRASSAFLPACLGSMAGLSKKIKMKLLDTLDTNSEIQTSAVSLSARAARKPCQPVQTHHVSISECRDVVSMRGVHCPPPPTTSCLTQSVCFLCTSAQSAARAFLKPSCASPESTDPSLGCSC